MIKKKISKYRLREACKPLVPDTISSNDITTIKLDDGWYINEMHEGRFDQLYAGERKYMSLKLITAPQPPPPLTVIESKAAKEIHMGVGES